MVDEDGTGRLPDEFYGPLLEAGENASRDADELLAKIATAGIGAILVLVQLEHGPTPVLSASGILFGAGLIAALLSVRLSADALHKFANEERRPERMFLWVRVLNYVALATVIAATVCAVVSLLV